jgi:diguanylate cyclase (GGDEF)-like protein
VNLHAPSAGGAWRGGVPGAATHNSRMATPSSSRTAPSHAQRLARQAWLALHTDSARSIALADRALELARARRDVHAEAQARLARGYHVLYFATPDEAVAELQRAERRARAAQARGAEILARAGQARALWRAGRFDEALGLVLPLRDEGLVVLKNEQRGVLLNTIAGCWSALGRSDQAFAYMFEALRESGPGRGHGFDVVLYCNLAHELLQIGDYNEALGHIDVGLTRCANLANPRLLAVLLINRVICLTELERGDEALPDIVRLSDMPTDASGRGLLAAHFETLAIAALRAGELGLGRDLVAQAIARGERTLPEERLELAIARALLAAGERRLADALAHLDAVHTLAHSESTAGLSLRVRCGYFHALSELHEARGDAPAALAAVRHWQHLQLVRAQLASAARYQAAALQTELMRLQHRLDESSAARRATERARRDLAQANAQLSRKIEEVEALQAALRQQATHDALTGLFNRRHLDDVLPAMWALARRNREPLSAAILDLDRFKAVNDRHGHGAGDRLLSAFGTLLATGLRKSDVAVRWGGEEFCVLMPRTDAAAARRKVQALLRRWRAHAIDVGGGMLLTGLSFSAGVADSEAAPASAQALLQQADALLLEAKRAGRDRVLLAPAATAA